MGEEEKWKLEVSSMLGEIRADLRAVQKSLNDHVKSEGIRIEDLEHTLNGNGSAGVAEQVRNLKSKWAILYGIGLLVTSAALNYVVEASVLKQTATTRVATAEEMPSR